MKEFFTDTQGWLLAGAAALFVIGVMLIFSGSGGDSKPCVRISVVVVQQNGQAGLPQVVSQGCER